MTNYQFDQDIKVERLSEGRYRSKVDAGWNIGDNPNGGYLITLVDSAIRESILHPDPVSITTHFLRPGVAGEDCEITVEIFRSGRTVTNVHATLSQKGKSRLEVVAVYSDLTETIGLVSEISIPPRQMPGPEDCVPRTGDIQGIDIALIDKLDIRLQPELASLGESGVSEIAGWVRHRDGRAPDTRSLLLFVDCFPPSPLGVLGPIGWVPSVELTVHVRRRPASGWIKASLSTNDLAAGRMVESGCLWDSDGVLVAECRQLAIVRK